MMLAQSVDLALEILGCLRDRRAQLGVVGAAC